ncbi:hypothetical protein CBF34_03445 [Vagococcus penaei]|uniref:Uncharacterized protein n=2 Tax=Vagococcus penaei TaxID=633807 RepID=A0A1Q2D7J3_9ENTE|nr:hypothetical protein [Vagococcus penaei]AQP54290.1 hypothetical protein BW732_08690 [Vagococcus penaei]RSU05824.1 hypothetical protein CBF34_03445 [Vagococcus penaei]
MRKVFAIDGWYFRIFSKLANLMILNLLFILSVIPIVTAGIGLMSLIKTVQELRQDEMLSVVTVYARNFKQNIMRGLILLGVEVIGLAIPMSIIYLSLMYLPFLATLLMIVFSFVLLILSSFPLIYSLENQALIPALYQTIGFVTTKIALAIAIFIVPLVVGYLSFKVSLIFLFFMGISLIVYAQLSLMRR